MKLFCLPLLFLLLLQGASSLASEPQSLKKLQSVYSKSTQKYDEESQACIQPLSGSYNKSLSGILSKAKKDGDLDALIAIKNEQQRFKQEESIPLTPPDGLHPLIINAQTAYHNAVFVIIKEQNIKVARLLQQYIKQLEKLKLNYVRSEEVEDATKVNDTLAQAKAEYIELHTCIHSTKASPSQSSLASRGSLSLSMRRGLIRCYRFDRPESRISDKSVKKRYGKPAGCSWHQSGRSPANGAYDFDGADDYIESDNKIALDKSGTFTVAFWMKPHSWDGVSGIICKKAGADAKGFMIYREPFSGNKLSIRAFGSKNSYVNLDSKSDVDVGEWQHWTAVYSASEKEFTWYKNGKEDRSYKNIELGDLQNDHPLEFGRSRDWSGYFHGLLDDIMIWNRALTEQDIQQLGR